MNKEPVYTYQKEKEYLFTMPVYNDVIRFYKYNTRVTQTNPAAVVSDEEIKAKEEEINQKVEIVNHDVLKDRKGFMKDVGFEVNGESFDYNLCLLCGNKEGEFIKPDKYIALGRDSLITLFKKGFLLGHIFTFSDLKEEFAVSFNATSFLDGNELDLFIADNSYLGDVRAKHDAFHLNTALPMPGKYTKEYMLVYDRFDNRSYTGKDGNEYYTKVECKYLKDIKDFDAGAKTKEPIDMTAVYPVIQWFQNGALLFEGYITQYVEWYERSDNQTKTDIGFSAFTLKNGYCVTLEYKLDNSMLQFELIVNDLAHPAPGENFSQISRDLFYIIDDSKPGSKKSVSVMESSL